MNKTKKLTILGALIIVASALLTLFLPASNTFAAAQTTHYHCGGGGDVVNTTIDFGCKGQGSATMDLLFAIIRFLSDGVGLIIIASIIIAGVQYTFSRGDPQAVVGATKRIQSSVIALAIFIFAYALLDFVIPNGMFGL